MRKFVGLGAFAGLLLGGCVSAFGFGARRSVEGLSLSNVDIQPQWESAWVRETIADDPAAEAIVSGYVTGLSAAGYEAGQQGVWVASGEFPIAQHQGGTLRSAASITKVATTLAALATWDAEAQFETLVGWQGSIEDGVLKGDLIVEGGGDPLFVWEEAIALGNTLQKIGIRRVTGDLIVTNAFSMNFESDPLLSGQWLKEAFNRAEWGYDVERAHLEMPPGTSEPKIQIDGQVRADVGSWQNRVSGQLVSHQSLPLVAVLKAMNIYSNNPMAEQMANTLGGSQAVMQKVEEVTGIPSNEMSLINGSGLGEENQMSPRAAVAMLQKIQEILRSTAGSSQGVALTQRYTISDIFPIAGADGGTVRDRGIPNNAVVKTGSLAVVSALAGAMPTKEKGVVWFSLLNYGSGLDALRSRQDQVLNALENQWGRASEIPPELQTTVRIGEDPYRFGDERRNQVIYESPEP